MTITIENKIEKHIKDIAIMLADMAYFIPPKVVDYIVKKNEEQFEEFKELFEGRIEISHYLFEGSSCVFPGVRRPASRIAIRGNVRNYNKEAKAIEDGNERPRYIWSALLKDKKYSGKLWKETELCEFEIAHLFPHKDDDESLRLVRNVFDHTADARKFFSNFTGAGNTVLLPKGSVRPTDTCPEIKIIFFRRYLDLYGEKCLMVAQGFKNDKLPSWYNDLKWNDMELPNDWEARIDNLIWCRTEFIYDRLHKEFGESVKRSSSFQSGNTWQRGQIGNIALLPGSDAHSESSGNNIDLEEALRSIGKRCFVNCFEMASQKNGILTDENVLECDPEIIKKTGGEVSYNALATRRSCIRKIFKNGKQTEALKICIDSGAYAETIEKARKLYDR